jgi:putative transposase
MARRHELTDTQWEAIQEFLPGKDADPGRTAVDNRLFVNAVLFVLKTGIPWADLPERYGKWNSVWRRFDRWCAKGVWQRIFQALGEEHLDEELEEVHLDSTVIKAHQTASTGRRYGTEKKTKLTNVDALAEAEED